MDNKAGNNLYRLSKTCSFCHLRDVCLLNISDLEADDSHEKIVQHPKPLSKKQHLFRQGGQFNNLYVVRSGCLKNYFYGLDGKEQIVDFVQPGEIIGLDSMDKNNYVSSAVALETTSVCKLPLKYFKSLCQKNPFMYDHFFHLACKKITSSYNLLHLLRDCPAEVKLASFLLNYSSRKGKYGYSRLEFSLSMPRYDIANYLGLAIETVSRALSNFDNEGILCLPTARPLATEL